MRLSDAQARAIVRIHEAWPLGLHGGDLHTNVVRALRERALIEFAGVRILLTAEGLCHYMRCRAVEVLEGQIEAI